MNPPTHLLSTIFWLLGGLALFLYGIDMMGTAMRRAAGPALRGAFDRATRTRFHGLLTGIIVTALIQSSSAATVMVVGFINAGLLTFENSIGLILGANVGATITPFFTAFDIDVLVLPLIGIGFLIGAVTKRRILQQVGWACMGFGILFFGLMLMKLAVGPYRDTIQAWLASSAGAGLAGKALAFLAATAATGVIQSSAATIAMLQALAIQGAIADIHVAIPLILGAQVGTCITAILAALRSSLSARRAAVAHLVFNLIGVLLTAVLAPLYVRVLPYLSLSLAHEIANCHFLIRLVNVVILLPFARLYGRLIMRILPGTDTLSARPIFLDFTRTNEAGPALDDAGRELRRVLHLCVETMRDAVESFLTHDDTLGEGVLKREVLIDDLSQTTAEYLARLAKQSVPAELSARPALLLHQLHDAERIGDHAENIIELSDLHRSRETRFSEDAVAEVRHVSALVQELGEEVERAAEDGDADHMVPVLAKKRAIDEAVERYLDAHADRLSAGDCNAISGMLFVELVTNLRRVANHLRNIAASATSKLPEHARRVQRLGEGLEE